MPVRCTGKSVSDNLTDLERILIKKQTGITNAIATKGMIAVSADKAARSCNAGLNVV